MIRSMTAFARTGCPSQWGMITWELRSVNHRYLELSIRLPDALRALETLIRERAGDRLSRGKVELNLKFQASGGELADIALNRHRAERLLAVAAELEPLMGPGAGLSTSDVLSWPGVVSEAEPDVEPIKTDILTCLDEALQELVATREREGMRIMEMIRQRCEAITEQVRQVRARRPEVLTRLREKLLARLADLPVEPDTNRLEQELVIIAQRLDLEEELDRLDAHVDEVGEVLRREEPVGRRLDFLMQELNREANTLSSKSGDAETTRAGVEIKVLIEQMREQIQNIE